MNANTTPLVGVGETDDPRFIQLVNSLLNGVIASDTPDTVWVIKIENWFDHKWLQFSGIGIVDYKFPAFLNWYDAALEEFRQEKVTFPPFTPNRVLGQWSYQRTAADYSEVPVTSLPHVSKKQRSEKNLQRRVQNSSRSGVFLWYSSNTVTNDRASIMVYTVRGEHVDCWFTAFLRQEQWVLHSTKGVSRGEVQRFLNDS
jgi:hypothetical protein